MDEPTITSEEAETLSQEGELLAKKEQGDNLEPEEEKTLGKINSLKEEIKERFKEKDIPQKTKEEILSLQAQKEHFRTKFGKEKEEREKLAKELEVAKATKKPESESEIKVDAILEIQKATKELDDSEIAELQNRAKMLDVSLFEARKDENFLLWQTAHREKVAKENVPSPNSRQLSEGADKPLADMTTKEKEEYFTKKGWYKSPKKYGPQE